MRKKFKSRRKTREDHDQRQHPQDKNKKSSGGKGGTRLATALLYAKAGLPVVPLYGRKGSICTCGDKSCAEPGNHARTSNGFRDATTDSKKITKFWQKWPNAKIALPFGFGVIAVVVEGQVGRKALKNLEKRNEENDHAV